MPIRPIAVARAAVGLLALMAGTVTHHALRALFEASVVRAHEFERIPDLRFEELWPLTVVWSLAALGFALGVKTRLCAALMVAIVAFVFAADQAIYAGYLYVVGLLTLLLTLAGGGAHAFGDGAVAAADAPAWPITLAKVQVSLIYLFTATAKLNFHFLSGSILRNSLFVPFPSHWPQLWFQLLALLVILTEYFLGIGLWVRSIRPAAFVVGLAFHCSIVVLLKGTVMDRLELFVFGGATLTPYLFFVEAGFARRTVIWDDRCDPCHRWMGRIRRLDWLGIHDFRPSSAGELQLIGIGAHHRGFVALREILEALPVSFLWAPVLRLRPFRAIGERAYRAIASRPVRHDFPVTGRAVGAFRPPEQT